MKDDKSIFSGIKIVLWDIDGTIMNFFEAQKNAIRVLFKQFDIGECSDEMLLDYDSINHKYWKALERGEITKPRVLTGRFYEFFEKYGIRTDIVESFNDEYQVRLGDTICFYPGSMELIENFKKNDIVQFAVTNGTKIAQNKKLAASGLDKIFDGIFISEDVGYEKPNPEFFAPVYKESVRRVPDIKLSEIIIIGDSLTSDMKLGNNVGIKTCWFNPSAAEAGDIRIDMEINDFTKLY